MAAAPLPSLIAPEEAAQDPPQDPQAPGGPWEDFILDATFAACDPEQTGWVSPGGVVALVALLTGHSGGQSRGLRALGRALDPRGLGTQLDLPTFRSTMRSWIRHCHQNRESWALEDSGDSDSPEPEGRVSPLSPDPAQEDSDSSGTATPSDATALRRMAEEVSGLRARLRGSQRALEQAQAVAEGLEEENEDLRRVEQEQRWQRAWAESLQEENQRLREELQELRDQVAWAGDTEAQLRRCTAQLSARDTALQEAERRLEELTLALEDSETTVQELQREARRPQRGFWPDTSDNRDPPSDTTATHQVPVDPQRPS